MILSMIMILIIITCCEAFLRKEGFWNNFLLFMNMILALLMAINLWEPLATFLDKQERRGTYWWDFTTMWTVFLLTFIILRVFTDLGSRHKLRLPLAVDALGSHFFASAVGFLLFTFLQFSCHTAGLPVKLSSLKRYPEQSFAAFLNYQSKGSMAGLVKQRTFDPGKSFFQRYEQRRIEYSNSDKFLGN